MLPIDVKLLKPGMKLAVGLSGGADSVALLRALAARSSELGLVLHAAHLHHGLRGAEADEDLAFTSALAAGLDLPFHEAHVDTAFEAQEKGETLEEAARRLRYAWFRQLLASRQVDAIDVQREGLQVLLIADLGVKDRPASQGPAPLAGHLPGDPCARRRLDLLEPALFARNEDR